MDKIIKKITKEKIAIAIYNTQQEKKIRKFFKELGYKIPKKDKTIYSKIDNNFLVEYPIYFILLGFENVVECCWSADADFLKNKKYKIIEYKQIRKEIEQYAS